MGANGEDAHVVVPVRPTDSLHLPSWSADGIAYGRLRLTSDKSGGVTREATVELLDTNGQPTVVLSEPRLSAGVSLSDGRWLYCDGGRVRPESGFDVVGVAIRSADAAPRKGAAIARVARSRHAMGAHGRGRRESASPS